MTVNISEESMKELVRRISANILEHLPKREESGTATVIAKMKDVLVERVTTMQEFAELEDRLHKENAHKCLVRII